MGTSFLVSPECADQERNEVEGKQGGDLTVSGWHVTVLSRQRLWPINYNVSSLLQTPSVAIQGLWALSTSISLHPYKAKMVLLISPPVLEIKSRSLFRPGELSASELHPNLGSLV